jgi:hypothetical protein
MLRRRPLIAVTLYATSGQLVPAALGPFHGNRNTFRRV